MIWAIVGVFRITADFSFVSYLPQGTLGERNFLATQRLFPGTLPLVILIEGAEPVAADPQLIRTVSGLQKRLEAESAVVYTSSYVDIMRQAAVAFDGDGAHPHPGDENFSRDLAAQLLFLSYSPHYETFLTRDLKRAVVWVFLREAPTETIQAVIDDAKRFVQANGTQGAWDVQIGGGVAATRVALTESIVRGKIANIVIVLGVIFVVSSAIFRSLLGGALVLLPLVFTVLVDLGILGNFGIPLDPITASVAAMAVGIGADYAIYLIYRMREEVARGADPTAAMERAMVSAGRGIFCVATAIAGGYLTLSVSSFRAFTMVGILVSSTMVFSSLVSLTLLPLVVMRLRPRMVFGNALGNARRRKAT
jgi:predicted RND superfamily exporter protein